MKSIISQKKSHFVTFRLRGGPGGMRHGPDRVLLGPHHLHAPPLTCLRRQGRPGKTYMNEISTF